MTVLELKMYYFSEKRIQKWTFTHIGGGVNS